MDELEDMCQTAANLAATEYYKIVLIVKCIAFAIGTMLFFSLFFVQGSYSFFHPNARLLLIMNQVWAICGCATYAILDGYNYWRFSTHYSNPCDYLVSAQLSVAMRAPSDICLYGQTLSILMLAIERIIATVRIRSYESSTSTLIAWIMIVAEIVIAVSWVLLMLVDYPWSEMKVSCTVSSKKTANRFQIMMLTMEAVEIFALLLFIGLYRFNRARCKFIVKTPTSGINSLTARYQVRENLRAVSLIMPYIVIHVLCFSSTLIAQPVNTYLNIQRSPTQFIIFIEVFNFFEFYAISMPAFVLLRQPFVVYTIKQLQQYFPHTGAKPLVQQVPPLGASQEGDIYFIQLKGLFDGPLSQTQPKFHGNFRFYGLKRDFNAKRMAMAHTIAPLPL